MHRFKEIVKQITLVKPERKKVHLLGFEGEEETADPKLLDFCEDLSE